MPYPDRVDNYFAVDPTKWHSYAMAVYRAVGVNRPDGTENVQQRPMPRMSSDRNRL
jgi:hypothetical protein